MMSANHNTEIFDKLPGPEYDLAIQPYTSGLKAYVDKMHAILDDKGPLADLLAFRESAIYCQWPIRQLEYSFADRCLPAAADMSVLDVGAGVTPWPYFMASK